MKLIISQSCRVAKTKKTQQNKTILITQNRNCRSSNPWSEASFRTHLPTRKAIPDRQFTPLEITGLLPHKANCITNPPWCIRTLESVKLTGILQSKVMTHTEWRKETCSGNGSKKYREEKNTIGLPSQRKKPGFVAKQVKNYFNGQNSAIKSDLCGHSFVLPWNVVQSFRPTSICGTYAKVTVTDLHRPMAWPGATICTFPNEVLSVFNKPWLNARTYDWELLQTT